MKQDEIRNAAMTLLVFTALGLVLTGLWLCWPPLSLVAAGIVLFGAAGNLKRKNPK